MHQGDPALRRKTPKPQLDALRQAVAVAFGAPVARGSMRTLVDIVLEDGLPSRAEREALLARKLGARDDGVTTVCPVT
jgi:hypothetical protein